MPMQGGNKNNDKYTIDYPVASNFIGWLLPKLCKHEVPTTLRVFCKQK